MSWGFFRWRLTRLIHRPDILMNTWQAFLAATVRSPSLPAPARGSRSATTSIPAWGMPRRRVEPNIHAVGDDTLPQILTDEQREGHVPRRNGNPPEQFELRLLGQQAQQLGPFESFGRRRLLQPVRWSAPGPRRSTSPKVNLPTALITDPILIAFNAGYTGGGQPRIKIYGYSKTTNVGILMRRHPEGERPQHGRSGAEQ